MVVWWESGHGPTTNLLLVNYAISGTAVNGFDYRMLCRDVIFATGQRTVTIEIDPIDVGLISGSKTVKITLSPSSDYVVDNSRQSDTVTIDDNSQPEKLLTNPSFEEPGTGKIMTGWDTVPGWFSGGTATDSGVEDPLTTYIAGTGYDGNWTAYSWSDDAEAGLYANQTTSYVMQEGDTLSLSLLARPDVTVDANWNDADTTLHYTLYYGGTSTSVGTPFYQGYFDLGTGNWGNWSSFSASGITVPAVLLGRTSASASIILPVWALTRSTA